MLEKLAELEQLSRQLDPDPAFRKDLLRQAGDYSESFLQRLPESDTYVRDSGQDGFSDWPVAEEPVAMAELLEFFQQRGRHHRYSARVRRPNGLYPGRRPLPICHRGLPG